MTPQPQTEADSLEMTNTVQMIKMSHSEWQLKLITLATEVES